MSGKAKMEYFLTKALYNITYFIKTYPANEKGNTDCKKCKSICNLYLIVYIAESHVDKISALWVHTLGGETIHKQI